MRQVASFLLILSGVLGRHALAEDLWAVQFSASGGIVDPPCAGVIWWDDLIFHNATSADAVVRWIDTSNGGAVDPQPLLIPAGRTRSGFDSFVSEISSWSPGSGSQLWVVHLDVPVGVSIASRAMAVIGTDPASCGPDPSPTAAFGGPRLPHVRSLIPAGVPQVLLAIDIGEAANFGGSRTKIAVYNAGTLSSTANIELHRACDDTAYDFRTALVPAGTIIQVGGFRSPEESLTPGGGCVALNATASQAYAVVTVDQPSFSFATTLSNDLPPRTPFGFAAAE